jgi:ATP-dependent helicase/nuclease subunit A
MSLTPAQTKAINSRGNTVVIAGAGTGKTQTLIERAMRFVLEEGVSLDEILMVTFTEAAAAEMRNRIRTSLEKEFEKDPKNARFGEQLALLDSAHICTLHSFCLKLVREHFYELDLDPQLSVLAEDQSRLLATETLDEIFRRHYAGKTPAAEAVLALLQLQTRSKEQPVRELILEIHEYTQTRPNPKRWFGRQIEAFSQTKPLHWQEWLMDAVWLWISLSLPLLQAQPAENVNAHNCARLLKELAARPSRKQAAGLVKNVLAQSHEWPDRRKTEFSKPLAGFFKDAEFLDSLLVTDKTDPLEEDWEWVRHHMLALLGLAEEFEQEFSRLKRDSASVDFHDLEQFCLRLLWDSEKNGPTPLARQCREKLKLIFVDEYQDINEAQDHILTALGAEEKAANRFLVGDIKQSIYRFRQAAPRIFQGYAESWGARDSGGKAIFLSDNFRSHESLLQFINPFFSELMCKEVGGVQFRKEEELRFGNRENRAAFQAGAGGPKVELHLRFSGKGAESEDEIEKLSDAEREARLVAERVTTFLDAKTPVWDKAEGAYRAARPDDIVILMRSPRSKVETYGREFARVNLPLQATRTGFFESIEVQDLMNLLQLLDNPLQDVPTIAVLHSPLVGLSIDELAEVRLKKKEKHIPFWKALLAYHEAGPQQEGGRVTFEKVDEFLIRFARWRSMSRHSSLTRRLEIILAETNYQDWLLTQPRGEQRQANVYQLLAVAREFDQMLQQGLYRFLQLIDAKQEAAGDREPAPLEAEGAVRLMSIHQSKGLEFPIVFLPDLGKKFNLRDASGSIILDEEYGLCPLVKPPDTGSTYPSLPHWLASRRYRAEALGEELRILYVALTRAEQYLILSGTCRATAAARWKEKAAEPCTAVSILQANSCLEWLGQWSTRQTPDWIERTMGANGLWRWWVYHDVEALVDGATVADRSPVLEQLDIPPGTEEEFAKLRARLEWKYAYEASTLEPAKTTVTELRRKVMELDEESAGMESLLKSKSTSMSSRARGKISAPGENGLNGLNRAEIGVAHHVFLQNVSLDRLGSLEALRAEAERMITIGLFSPEEVAALDLSSILQFWTSEIGQSVLHERQFLKRELPFTLRLSAEDNKVSPFLKQIPAGEFVVVQGIADLSVIRSDEIWIVDFKTDQISEDELSTRASAYGPQIRLYGLALSRIYGKPVKHHWLHFLALGKTIES